MPTFIPAIRLCVCVCLCWSKWLTLPSTFLTWRAPLSLSNMIDCEHVRLWCWLMIQFSQTVTVLFVSCHKLCLTKLSCVALWASACFPDQESSTGLHLSLACSGMCSCLSLNSRRKFPWYECRLSLTAQTLHSVGYWSIISLLLSNVTLVITLAWRL